MKAVPVDSTVSSPSSISTVRTLGATFTKTSLAGAEGGTRRGGHGYLAAREGEARLDN
jgi:hypothetical protein